MSSQLTKVFLSAILCFSLVPLMSSDFAWAGEEADELAAVTIGNETEDDGFDDPHGLLEEVPSEQPSQQPAEQPAERPAEQPAEQPSEQPAQKPLEQPSGQPSERPVEKPLEKPSEKPASDKPAEQLIDPFSADAQELAPFAANDADVESLAATPVVSYQSHVQSVGWQNAVTNGALSGTTGRALRMEAIRISVKGVTGGISYRTHVQRIGWQSWVSNGSLAGTTGRALRAEAIEIKLTQGLEKSYDVYYRTHVASYGWLGWAKNGAPAGTAAQGLRMEAIEIRLVAKGQPFSGSTTGAFRAPQISYQSHVQGIGWQRFAADGATSGTTGQSKRVEALKISLGYTGLQGSIQYRARCYGVGWQDWKKDGQTAGTTGQSRPMQAVEIKLSEGSELARTYDVFYRVHVAGKGWLSWARNGQSAGTIGFFSRIEAIQIVLVPNGGIPGRASAPGSTARPCITIGYSAQAHVAQTGWLAKVTGRKAVGTLGQSRQMNAFLINIDDAAGVSGSIQYRALVAGSGWQGWVSAGAIAGSVNNPKRIEAIGIRLTGELANQYDVYYRAHCASIGWLSWAKNGANAGTATLGLRLEAFEIVLALQGGPAPGSTAQPYMEKLRIRILDPSKPMIALTFDGGPSAYTTRVVNILDRYKARGTFFVIGNYVNNNPGIVRDAFMRGHEIAGHSMRHPDYTTLSYSAIQADILSTNQTIRNATGSPPPPFYRAPFGALNQNVRNASAGVGHSIIQWNLDTIDWRDQNTSIVYSRVMNNARHGAIVLFHDTQPTTLAAVEKAVPDLIARGYQLVTVSELMYYTKTSFVPGQVYYSG